ncbi:ABC transporter permease subunit [Salinisphaera sp. LB1]|uniref:ABC transporter permease subunit n=1 Tax=Salinisphaera sp. LB1 TaxID=2183911 RepID=UPI000D705BCD|nr:ABC transporter permease subunit [Salinisphaera sp. LB1]AWN15208.1 Oligopeptide transport system permease protein OppC [Salinisphaera sp. LB1]
MFTRKRSTLEKAAGGNSLGRDAIRRLRANKAAMGSLIVLGLIVLMVIVAPWLTPNNYFSQDYNSIWTAPTLAHGHIFGTDSVGRDLFVRTMVGGRISLMVGVVTAFVSLIIGVIYGATAGYVGGRVDGFLMRTVDVLYALPFFFFVILLVVYFGQNLFLMFIAIGAVSWLDMARIVRGQTLTIKQQPYVEAARMAGAGGGAIIARHVVPNLLGLIIVYVTLTIPQVMLFESFLSYLGLGVQEPMTSWGALINDGTGEMGVAPWLLIIPSIFLAVTLFCFNFIGDGLRDALDPNDR